MSSTSFTFSLVFTALLGVFTAIAMAGCDNDDVQPDAGPDLSAIDSAVKPDLTPVNVDAGGGD